MAPKVLKRPAAAQEKPGKSAKTGAKEKGFPCTCGHRHFKECTCEENRQFIELCAQPTLPIRKGNPLEDPTNFWMLQKERENADLDKILNRTQDRYRGTDMENKASGLRSEDVSEFAEPELHRAPHKPTIEAAPIPTTLLRGFDTNLADLQDVSFQTDALFTKSQLTGANDEF